MFQPNRTIGKSEIDALDLTKRVTIEAEITDARAAALLTSPTMHPAMLGESTCSTFSDPSTARLSWISRAAIP